MGYGLYSGWNRLFQTKGNHPDFIARLILAGSLGIGRINGVDEPSLQAASGEHAVAITRSCTDFPPEGDTFDRGSYHAHT